MIDIMAGEIRIQLHQTAPSTSEATIRQHSVLIDRPVEKGGSDLGPMGGELFLASLGGCFMSNLLAAMRAREVEISGIRTEVIGTLAGDSPARFTGVELCVSAESEVDRELFERLVTIAERGCIMVNTLRGKLKLQVRIGAPV